jgi:hypothetical protein
LFVKDQRSTIGYINALNIGQLVSRVFTIKWKYFEQ